MTSVEVCVKVSVKVQTLPQNTLNTLVNKSEGPCLQTISPHLELVGGRQCLPTKSSRSLLPTTCRHKHQVSHTGHGRAETANALPKSLTYALVPTTKSHPSRFQKDRRCCGSVQFYTRCQSPWCNVCKAPRSLVSPNRMRLEATSPSKSQPRRRIRKKNTYTYATATHRKRTSAGQASDSFRLTLVSNCLNSG